MAFDPTQLEAAREGFDPARLESLKRAQPQTALPAFKDRGQEEKFQQWYKQNFTSRGLNPDPDAPQHFYDYRRAFQDDMQLVPDPTDLDKNGRPQLHGDSKYKLPGHPREFVDTERGRLNTKTGEIVPASPRESLYDETGRAVVRQTPQTGMPSSGGFDFGTSAKQVGRYVYDNFIQGQIIPIAASIAATRLPAVAAGTTAKNIISPLVEGAYQGTAGYLADKANQALDISPPGEDQAIAQGGVQGVAAMGQKAFRIMRPWHGREGAVRANEIASAEAKRMIDPLRPPQPSSTLFTEATKDKVTIPMTETRKFIRDAVYDMTRHDPTYNAKNLPQKLRENYGAAGVHMYKLLKATDKNTPLPSDTWAWFHSNIGKEVKDMSKPGISSKGQGEASQIYEKMLNDIEKVEASEQARVTQAASLGLPKPTTGQGATKLLEALSTYRREQSVARLEQHVKDAMDISRGQGADRQFNARTVIKALEKDRFFSKAFTPSERKDIQDTLTILNRAPYLPPPTSGALGAVHSVERGAGALGGASVGGFWGAVAGFSARDLLRMTENISFAMSTKTGRALVRELAQSKGGFTNKRNASVIASYVTAIKNQPMDEGDDGE